MKTIILAPKLVFLTLFFIVGNTTTFSQLSQEIVEERAEKMHAALQSADESNWTAYIKANYSKKMLEKYEMARHLGMFKRLNKDFSDSQIVSLKVKEGKVLMNIERNSDKHLVTFIISFDKEDDYKFNGFSVEAGEL